ncbi:hypothetical protein FACS1894205_6590 [Alphaproteobacteria bacterium]|nr:hypothetical protein FACS1894205_6590 [Alphaproteobacteria bacterium]
MEKLFDALGFSWDEASRPPIAQKYSIKRVCFRFQKMLPEFVWDASMLEGNPFTYPEVLTLLDGVTVGGKKLFDQNQILNLAKSSKHLLALVQSEKFGLTKEIFTELHGVVAFEEALEWGVFRGEGEETCFSPHVALGEAGHYDPIPTSAGAKELNEIFSQGSAALESSLSNPLEKGIAFFLFGALQQFFFDGNKRTSRFMMNGTLLSHGIDAISVPAARAQEFNEKMVRFYCSRDAGEMMAFMVDCHPELGNFKNPKFRPS